MRNITMTASSRNLSPDSAGRCVTVATSGVSTRLVAARVSPAPTRVPCARERVLLICYHFPPDVSVGAVRPAKFAKYLSRLRWQPYILTVEERYIPVREETRLDEVVHLPIVRTRVWPTLVQLALLVTRRLHRPALRARRASVSAGAGTGPAKGRSLSAHFKRYLNSLFELPDRQVGWLIPAAWAAYRLVKTHDIRFIVTSSPPRTTALIGLLLSYVARVKLVTDLRDPWFVPYLQDSWFLSQKEISESRSALADKIEGWLEWKILDRSARVITTTERHAAALRDSYPGLPADRISIIPNGYDAEDFGALGPAAAPQKFTISYFGSFYLDRTPRHFFEALNELIRDGRLSPSGLAINLIGEVHWTRDGSLQDLILSSELAGCVSVQAPIAYRECLRRMMEAHVLLLFQPRHHCSIPAKAFEYLALRKRILCLAHDGATADLIHNTGAGLVVPPEDVSAIKAAILRLVEEFQAGRPVGYRSDVSLLDREALAREFSRLLNELR